VVDVDTLDLPEIDIFSPEFLGGSYDLLRDARAQHWLARTPIGYLALTYDSVHAVLRHPDIKFATTTLIGAGERSDLMLERSQRNLLHRHGPDHTSFRKLVSRAFTPRTVERVRPAMLETLDAQDGLSHAARSRPVRDRRRARWRCERRRPAIRR